MSEKPRPSEIDVDCSRVEATSASYQDAELHESDGRRLILEPNRGYFKFAWGFLAVGGLFIPLLVLINWRQAEGRGSALLVACGFLAVGAAMFSLRRRFVFDRETGELRMRSGLTARSLPLSDVRAVQVIHGGAHESSYGSRWESYQLNLVLGDERLERVNLSDQPNRTWAVTTGSRLAEFLDAPLLGLAEDD